MGERSVNRVLYWIYAVWHNEVPFQNVAFELRGELRAQQKIRNADAFLPEPKVKKGRQYFT
jgi:hypothetical protein